ncbi:PilZ domain-containing protein [Clostridium vincentii]|uniref:PilZ domain protein n=1 Tax=Clostridium vincentii TaxID=52704 RepID=A0A2T0BGJ3_9CLOT|nr:PilZ domain-containing protein [Clostridium vincentii]PRR83005.1 PilZ domain protein [Clostridium vincentii]
MEEKRRTKRTGIEKNSKVRRINNAIEAKEVDEETFEVQITNISKGGIAFKSEKEFTIDTFLSANVILWTKETFDTIVKIVRIDKDTHGKSVYGCAFVGIAGDNEAKIDVYQIVNEVFE